MTTFQKFIKGFALALAIFLCFCIIGGGIAVFSSLSFIFSDKSISGETVTYNISNNILELDLDVSTVKMNITSGETFKVETNHKYLKVNEKEKKLEILENNPVFFNENNDVWLNITLPKNANFETVKMSTGVGKVLVDELNTSYLDLDIGLGDVSFKELNVNYRSDIDGGAGKFNVLSGELYNLDFDMGVGEFVLQAQIKGNSSLDLGVGNSTFKLIGDKDDYQIQVDKGMGNAKVDNVDVIDNNIYGYGDNFIKINGGIGNIDIIFLNDFS